MMKKVWMSLIVVSIMLTGCWDSSSLMKYEQEEETRMAFNPGMPTPNPNLPPAERTWTCCWLLGACIHYSNPCPQGTNPWRGKCPCPDWMKESEEELVCE